MPEQMLLTEVLSCLIAIGFIGGIVIWVKRAKDNFCHRAEAMLGRVDAFALANNISPNTLLDIEMDDPSNGKDFDPSKVIDQTYIGREVEKGYDMIRTRVKRGFVAPYHSHRTSDEFVYILRGKVLISTKVGDRVTKDVLTGDDYCFLTHREEHSVEALAKSDLIIVALPPLIKEA